MQYAGFSVTKVLTPEFLTTTSHKPPTIMGLQVSFENCIFLFFQLESCSYQKICLLSLFNKKQN